MNTRATQRGVTALGWLVLLIPVAIVVYAGIRLAPLYLNYMKVARSLEQVATEFKGDESITPPALRTSLEKHFDIESLDSPTVKDIDIHRDGKTWVMEADYDGSAPLFSNISLVIQFDKKVSIQ